MTIRGRLANVEDMDATLETDPLNDPQKQEDFPDALGFHLDGTGKATAKQPAEFAKPPSDQGFDWIHLRLGGPETRKFLDVLDLDDFVIEALTAEETRPRCTVHGEGAFMTLRGVNLDPGAEPEDMISVRFWIETHRIIGVWRRPLYAVADLKNAIERNLAPLSPGEFIAKLALRLADRAEPSVASLNEEIDTLEEQVLDPDVNVSRGALAGLRRKAILLRRYMIPQRDALTTLEIEDLLWLLDSDRAKLREAAERIFRLGEELDAIRDRAQIVHDQIMDRRAERMNQRMLILAIVSAIFLPLGLLTGLLGINVGGMPGANWPPAFWVVTALILGLGGLLVLLFRQLGLFR